MIGGFAEAALRHADKAERLVRTDRADLVLDAQAGTVRLARRTLTGKRVEEFALTDLDSAEMSRYPRRGSGAIAPCVHQHPARHPYSGTGWGDSQGGMAPLAQKIKTVWRRSSNATDEAQK